jgi:hypothetical protein
VYCHVVEYDWLLGKDPLEMTINIPNAVLESCFELPSTPETKMTMMIPIKKMISNDNCLILLL